MANELKNHMKEVAVLLGVNLKEEFKVKPTELAKKTGYKCNEEKIYRFDYELSNKGYDDGWSEWYGGNYETLYHLLIGLCEVVKIDNTTEKGR